MTHDDQSAEEMFKIDLTIDGDLSIPAGGAVDVDALGYDVYQGPGKPSNYRAGGSYGGRGGKGSDGHQGGATYGSIVSPTNIGSGGSRNTSSGIMSGGGAVKLTVSGTTTLDGNITADGINTNGNAAGGGSGGSVWLTTASLAGSGTISADGGRGENNNGAGPGGGGGRVSVVLTGSGSFGSVVMQAYGGEYETPSALYDGAAGTVYKQTQGQGPGGGTMVVDNNGEATPAAISTYVPPESGGVTNELPAATMVVTNADTEVILTDHIYVGDILVYTDADLVLGSYTMYVDSAEHHIDDASLSGPGGPTNTVVDNYHQIVWQGADPGMVIVVR